MIKLKYPLVLALILAMVFLVTSVAADATQIALNAGNSQSAVAGTAVTTLPSVIVKDENNDPVIGVSVTFEVASGGGSITGGTATTGPDGIATVGSWTLGTTAGTNTLTATSGSLTGSPVTFTATGTAGAATQIAIHAGNGQSATIGTAVTTPPSVIVKDANGNPVSGVPVTFSVSLGGGTVSPTSSVSTDASGIAAVTSWTLGSTAGTNSLIATSGTLTGSPVTFSATGSSSTSAPTITSITPSTGINNGYVRSVDIYGSGFATGATVRLIKTGQANITLVNPNITSTDIIGDFNLNGATAGTWDVMVINSDLGTVTRSGGFTVVNASDASTVTAISPSSATTNTTVSATITGTGFQSTAKMRLARSGYNDILGTISSTSSTSIVGTFNLTNQVPGPWNACVLYDGTNRVCGPQFTINAMSTTGANGSIYFTSTPSSAVVFVDSVNKGNTPFTLYNVTPGSYVIKMQRASYLEWSERVTVTVGNQTTVTGKLTAVDTSTTAPPVTTIVVTTATLPPTTVKSTKTVPTPWKDTPTPASPVEITVIVGALAAGALVLRRK